MSSTGPIYRSNRWGVYDTSIDYSKDLSSTKTITSGESTDAASDFSDVLQSASSEQSKTASTSNVGSSCDAILTARRSSATATSTDNVSTDTTSSSSTSSTSGSGYKYPLPAEAEYPIPDLSKGTAVAYEVDHAFVDPTQSALGGNPVEAIKDVLEDKGIDTDKFKFEYGEGKVYHSWGSQAFYTLRISTEGQVVAEYDAYQVLNAPVTAAVSLQTTLSDLGISV